MAKPNEVEAFQSFCRRYINLEVKKYFNDVKGDDESLYTSSTARFVIRNICLHKDKDPLILSVGRMLVFYLIVNLEKEPQYEIERPRTDKIRSFKPIVTLYFVQSKLNVKEGFRPIDGRISFRLMNESSETLTKRKLETLARQIKKLFASNNGYIWKKGKFLYTYADWEKGYQLQVLARTEAQAKEIVTQVLKIQSHTPEWKNFFSGKNNITVKGKFLFLGEPRVKAEEREESEVIYDSEYVYAYIAKKIIEPLQPDFNQLQKIIANAWKVYKDSISES